MTCLKIEINRADKGSKGQEFLKVFEMKTEFVESANGHLFVMENEPQNPKASILFIHGVGEHIERYKELFEIMENYQLKFIGFDQRGFGRTIEKSGRKGLGSFEQTFQDIKFISEKYRIPGKHFLMGHSMGGGIVLNFGSLFPDLFDGIVASAPMILPGTKAAPNLVERALLKVVPKLFPSLVIPNILDSRLLSKDDAVVQEYRINSKNHYWCAIGLLADMVNYGNSLLVERASEFKLPVFILHGSDDLITHPEGSKQFIEKCGSMDKTIEILNGYYHEPHNEVTLEKQKVFELYWKWFEKRI